MSRYNSAQARFNKILNSTCIISRGAVTVGLDRDQIVGPPIELYVNVPCRIAEVRTSDDMVVAGTMLKNVAMLYLPFDIDIQFKDDVTIDEVVWVIKDAPQKFEDRSSPHHIEVAVERKSVS